MKLLDALVEQRIAAAAARGDLDDLPGSGRPQDLSDDPLVPEEVRVANRILKNAGFVPAAVEPLRGVREIEHALRRHERLVDAAPGAAGAQRAQQCRLRAKWLALNMALESLRGGPMVVPHEYWRRVAERLTASSDETRTALDS